MYCIDILWQIDTVKSGRTIDWEHGENIPGIENAYFLATLPIQLPSDSDRVEVKVVQCNICWVDAYS